MAFLWICDPDHTLHGVPLGSPAHADALRGAERCVAEVCRTVERLRAEGEDILLLVGSDHGQRRSATASTSRIGWPRTACSELAAGRRRGGGAGHVGAALRDRPRTRPACSASLDAMRARAVGGDVLIGDELAALGFAADGGVVAAINMARQGEANPYGVARPALGGRRKTASPCRSAAASMAAGGPTRRGRS